MILEDANADFKFIRTQLNEIVIKFNKTIKEVDNALVTWN
jgi:hypothetical protein